MPLDPPLRPELDVRDVPRGPLLPSASPPKKRSKRRGVVGGRRVVWSFSIAMLILASVGAASWLGARRLSQAHSEIENSYQRLAEIDTVAQLILSAESSHRGFALTGKDEFLGPYRVAVRNWGRAFERLSASVGAQQREALPRVRVLLARKMDMMEQGIVSRRTGGLESVSQLVGRGQGKRLMDQLRLELDAMRLREQVGIKSASERARETTLSVLCISAIGGVWTLVLASSALLQLRSDIRRREAAEQHASQSHALLLQFVEDAPAPVAMFDASGQLLLRSRRWLLDVENFDAEDPTSTCSGENTRRVLPGGWQEAMARCLQGHVEEREEDVVERNGHREWVRWEMRPWMAQQGVVGGAIAFIENITERKQAEEKLRGSEARYRDVVDSVHDIIFRTDEHWRWSFLNRAWQNVTGFEVAQALGKPVQEWIAPQDHARCSEMLGLLLRGERATASGVVLVRTQHGALGDEYRSCELAAQVVRDAEGKVVGLAGTLRDVSDRQRAEDALRDSESELRALFAAMNEVVLVLGRDGKYLRIAPTRPDLLLAAPQELLGRTLRQAEPEGADVAMEIIARVLDEGVREEMEYSLRIGEQEVWFHASIAPLTAESVLWVARDITPQRQEAQRREASRAGLRAVLDAADELLRTPDVDTLLRRAVELGRERFGLERCSIFLAMPDQDSLLGSYGTDIEGRTTDERARHINLPLKDLAPAPEGQRWHLLPEHSLHSWDGEENRTTERVSEVAATRIQAASGLIGFFYNDNGLSQQPLDSEKQQLIAVYCSVLGTLIQSKRDEEELRDARDELELRVQRRTSELLSANRDLQAQIVERRRAQLQEEALAGGLRSVLACADDLLQVEELDALLRRAVELGRENLGLERCSLFLLSPDCKYLQGAYGINFDGNLAAQHSNFVPLDEEKLASITATTAQRWSLISQDGPHFDWDEQASAIIELDSRGWTALTPILSSGGALGVLFNDAAISSSPLDEATQNTTALFASLLGSIIERKKVEAALQASEARLRLLFESMPHIIWTAQPNGDIDYYNAQHAHYTGRVWASDDALDTAQQWRAVVHPDDIDNCLRRWQHSIEAGHAYGAEYRLRRHDGEYRWHLGRALAHRDEAGQILLWVGSETDIDDQKKAQATLRRDRDDLERLVEERTSEVSRANVLLRSEISERRQTEIALRKSEDRFRHFMNTGTFVAFMKNHEGRFVFVNDALCRAFDVTPEQWLGRTVHDVCPPEVARPIAEVDELVLAGEETQIHTEHAVTADGQERIWLTYKFPLRDESGRKYLGGLAIDITEQQRAQRDLLQLTEDLKRSNAELEQFAYVASHDLQEPLRMVVSYLQLLERRHGAKLDGSAHEFIDFAVDGAHRMQNLINDLLEYSRVGRRARPFEPIELDQVLDDVLRVLALSIEEAGAHIERETLPCIEGDAGQVARLLQNLLANALKFRGPQPLEIQVLCHDAGEHWEIEVRDNGIGIAPAHQERIFAIFQRLHSREEYGGTGIGLAVVKKIAERHGGSIRVESTPGTGASFLWSVPKSTANV